jgi:hypothetical protein
MPQVMMVLILRFAAAPLVAHPSLTLTHGYMPLYHENLEPQILRREEQNVFTVGRVFI